MCEQPAQAGRRAQFASAKGLPERALFDRKVVFLASSVLVTVMVARMRYTHESCCTLRLMLSGKLSQQHAMTHQ